jgi:hypothetical protein
LLESEQVFRILIFTIAFCSAGSSPVHAQSQENLCPLLPPAQLEKILAQRFTAPQETVAPAAYCGDPSGRNATITPKKDENAVVFIVYVHTSASQAKQSFVNLCAWFPAKYSAMIGNSSYIDRKGAIHVLKGQSSLLHLDFARHRKALAGTSRLGGGTALWAD